MASLIVFKKWPVDHYISCLIHDPSWAIKYNGMDSTVPWHYCKGYYVVVQFLVVATLVEGYSSVIFG